VTNESVRIISSLVSVPSSTIKAPAATLQPSVRLSCTVPHSLIVLGSAVVI